MNIKCFETPNGLPIEKMICIMHGRLTIRVYSKKLCPVERCRRDPFKIFMFQKCPNMIGDRSIRGKSMVEKIMVMVLKAQSGILVKKMMMIKVRNA